MGLFQDTGQTERITVGDGWFELRKYITVGDEKAAQDAAVGSITWQAQNRRERRSREGTADAKASYSGTAYDVTLLSRMIVGWSEEAPVTPENVERLPMATVDLLMEKLDEWNTARSEEEADPLGPPSLEPSSRPVDGIKSSAEEIGLQSLPT